MTNAIKMMVSRCAECTACLPAQALEPQIATEATRPFKKFSIDLGKQKGKNYLIGVDRYLGWPIVAPLPKEDTKTITDILDDWFIEHGISVSISNRWRTPISRTIHNLVCKAPYLTRTLIRI